MKVLDHPDSEAIRALRERDEFFWLDLVEPSPQTLAELGAQLGIPQYAIEDTQELGQRPKVDDYGDRVLLVFYGADAEGLVEIHLHISGSEVVSVHQRPCVQLAGVRERVADHRVHTEEALIQQILGALTDSLQAAVIAHAEEVETLEQVVFDRPTEAQRRRISELRGKLFRLEQIIIPQREMLAANGELLDHLPGLERDEQRHGFRDVHDDLVLVANEIAYGREVLGEALNVYLSTTSNRLNETATRLTLVATLVLPLTLITGFFGQNFGWMTDHIDSLAAFLALGVGGMVVPTLIVLALFRRAGYLGGSG